VTIFVPPHKTDAPDGAMGEGIDIDGPATCTRRKPRCGA
jgi:hypothetical protein